MRSRRVRDVRRRVTPHWVGDGFPVRSLLSYSGDGAAISPFLLLDYGGPAAFEPSETPKGVGEHPHRGFETVTLVIQGELEHRDSAGNRGAIGPGDVQWMTAASGVVHEEFHSRAFTQSGGTLEMVQLWVNLPSAEKMAPPRYQEIRHGSIPTVPLDDESGAVRVIAGSYRGTRGPARTVTPVTLWDLTLREGRSATLELPEGHSAALLVLRGAVRIDGEKARPPDLILFGRDGEGITVDCLEDASALLLGGAPIDEPIAGYGPFVMNTREEITQAMDDYRDGRMGHLD